VNGRCHHACWESNMNNGGNDCQRLSRRVVLTGAALALGAAGAATAISQAAAQQKLSQADAKYQTTPKGDQRCDGCVNFQPRRRANSSRATLTPAAGANYLQRRPSPCTLRPLKSSAGKYRAGRFRECRHLILFDRRSDFSHPHAPNLSAPARDRRRLPVAETPYRPGSSPRASNNPIHPSTRRATSPARDRRRAPCGRRGVVSRSE
jgi:hypothetical protein